MNEIELTYTVRIAFKPEEGVYALSPDCLQRILRESVETHLRKLNISVTGAKKLPDRVEVS